MLGSVRLILDSSRSKVLPGCVQPAAARSQYTSGGLKFGIANLRGPTHHSTLFLGLKREWCRPSKLEICRLMVESKADVTDSEKQTGVTSILLSRSLSLRSLSGGDCQTALKLAIDCHNDRVMVYLHSVGAPE